MEVLNTAREFGDTVESLVAVGLKATGAVVLVGFVLILFGIPTYYNVMGDDYVEAAVGAAALLAVGAVILWWVYSRVDFDATLPSGTATSDDRN